MIHIVLIVLLVPVIYYAVVEWAASRVLDYRRRTGAVPNGPACLLREGTGFNPCNVYWLVEYDCRENDVEIAGVVPPARYWSLVAYDRYSLPLDPYLFDESVHADREGRYLAYLTTRPVGVPNELDVRASPRGTVIIRTSYPQEPDRVVQEAPQVRAISWSSRFANVPEPQTPPVPMSSH